MQTALSEFFRLGGSVRVVVTDDCTQSCVFCHREQPSPYSTRTSPSRPDPALADLHTVASALASMGARKLYITGGEPTTRTDLHELVHIFSGIEGVEEITLATNGAHLEEQLGRIRKGAITKIKISVHALHPSQNDLGVRTWRARDLTRLINICREHAHVELNVTLLRCTLQSVHSILSLAAESGVDVQVLELIWTPDIAPLYDREFVSSAVVRDMLISNGGVIEDCMGTTVTGHLTRVRWSGIGVRFYEPARAMFYGRACVDCPQRNACVEGMFAIRIGTNLTAYACLLRADLALDLKQILRTSQGQLQPVLQQWFEDILGPGPYTGNPRAMD